MRAQVGEPGEVEAIKAGVAVLKRLCRQRTLQAWKEWRHSVEAGRRGALQVGMPLRLLLRPCAANLPFFPCCCAVAPSRH